MRFTALVAFALVLAGCTKKDEAPAVDTTAMAPPPAPPAPVSLASMAGMWSVSVMPESKDTVLTTYTLDANDSTNWHFRFDKGGTEDVGMKVTGVSGDTVMSSTEWFKSSLRKGAKVRTDSKTWMQDGKLMGTTVAHYQSAGADSVVSLRTQGVKK